MMTIEEMEATFRALDRQEPEVLDIDPTHKTSKTTLAAYLKKNSHEGIVRIPLPDGGWDFYKIENNKTTQMWGAEVYPDDFFLQVLSHIKDDAKDTHCGWCQHTKKGKPPSKSMLKRAYGYLLLCTSQGE